MAALVQPSRERGQWMVIASQVSQQGSRGAHFAMRPLNCGVAPRSPRAPSAPASRRKCQPTDTCSKTSRVSVSIPSRPVEPGTLKCN